MSNSAKRSHAITQGAHVLVVDDDVDGAEAAGKLLETFGCNVSLVMRSLAGNVSNAWDSGATSNISVLRGAAVATALP